MQVEMLQTKLQHVELVSYHLVERKSRWRQQTLPDRHWWSAAVSAGREMCVLLHYFLWFCTSLRVTNYNCTLSTFFRHPRGQFASTSLRSVHDTQETPEQKKHGHFENPVSGWNGHLALAGAACFCILFYNLTLSRPRPFLHIYVSVY